MSGPYEQIDRPGHHEFRCKICGYQTFTKQGMWDHLERKHPKGAMDAESVS